MHSAAAVVATPHTSTPSSPTSAGPAWKRCPRSLPCSARHHRYAFRYRPLASALPGALDECCVDILYVLEDCLAVGDISIIHPGALFY